jgi:hypothetical protein
LQKKVQQAEAGSVALTAVVRKSLGRNEGKRQKGVVTGPSKVSSDRPSKIRDIHDKVRTRVIKRGHIHFFSSSPPKLNKKWHIH